MKIQVREYIEFVKSFTESANIMSKRFFIVIPYSPPLLNVKKEVETRLFGAGNAGIQAKNIGFEEHKTQLEQRMAVIQNGLGRTGVRTVPLGTEEVIELLYKQFNPGELEKPIMLQQQMPNPEGVPGMR